MENYDFKKINILICGIGGQGAVLFGNFLRDYFHKIGIPITNIKQNENSIKKDHDADFLIPIISGTESRGVSQREGSVIATIKLLFPLKNNNIPSDSNMKISPVLSPDIPPYSADIVYALEPIELLRNIKYIHPRSIVFLNRNVILPKNVIIEQVEYRRKERIANISNKNENAEHQFLSSEKLMDDLNTLLRTMYNPLITNNSLETADTDIDNKDLSGIANLITNKNISVRDFHYILNKLISKNSYLKENMMSKFPNFIDFDITNELINRDLGTLAPNFVLLGMSVFILRNIFNKQKISEFIPIYFKDKSPKIIELNKRSFDFGYELISSINLE